MRSSPPFPSPLPRYLLLFLRIVCKYTTCVHATYRNAMEFQRRRYSLCSCELWCDGNIQQRMDAMQPGGGDKANQLNAAKM